MTIDSSWIACFKEEIPAAFTPHPSFRPDAVFVDGQIRLMPSAVDAVMSWEEYIQRQFERHVARHFSRGVSCVILAFDDYAHVPSAKNMTQTKRRKNVPALDFHARDALPPCVPRGEEFTRCISNRTFKSKLIQLVIHRLTTNLKCDPGQCLVIDYCGPPVRHYSRDCRREPEPIAHFGALGEADVKFVRYTEIYDKLQVDSVDGDSIPIALLHMERGHSGNISVFRMQTRVKPETEAGKSDEQSRAKAGKEKPAAKKAKLSPEVSPAAACSEVSESPPEAKKKPPAARLYEYVDVRLLYDALVGMVVPQALGRSRLSSHDGHEISLLVCLIGLSGTDFTRGLPLVSGKTLYDFLPSLWVRLCRSYDTSARQLVPDAALDLLVSRIYHRKFERHTADRDMSDVLARLKASKLSGKTKDRLPEAETLLCTLRNTNWLLRYWRELDPPDPVQEEFGFCRTKTGAVQFCA